MTKFIAIDIETSGLDFQRDRIICVGFSNGYFVSFEEWGASKAAEIVNSKLKELKQAGNVIVGQNLSFDCKFLSQNGIELENEFDTMVAAYLLTDKPGRLGLDSLASYYLGLPSWKSDFKSGDAYKDPELMKLYCLQDCKVTEQLAYKLEEKLKEEGKLDFFYKLMKARQTLTRAEYAGIKLDIEATKKLIVELALEYEQQLKVLNSFELPQSVDKKGRPKTFNWSSPIQVKTLLKDHLGLNVLHPITKKESADIEVLEQNKNKHPLIPQLIKMRGTKKLIGALEGYIEDVGTDGRIHASLNITSTVTGRLSSSGPNIQQIDSSKKVRSLFITEPGYKLIVADLSAVEPRFLSHYSKDVKLLRSYAESQDLYGVIAVELLGADCEPNSVKVQYPEKRKVAKIIFLAISYGIGVQKLATLIQTDGGIPSFTLQDARNLIDAFFDKFTSIRQLQMNIHRAITSRGYLTNFEGRKVTVSEDKVHRDGLNTLLQSSASDFLLFKAVEFEPRVYELGGRILALIHDEILIEVPEAVAEQCAKELKTTVEKVSMRVPMVIETAVGANWGCKS